LVVPGLSLPWIIKKLNVSSQGSHKQEELDARIACAEAAMIKLQKISNTTNISIEYIDVIRQEYINRIHKISSRWISPEAESHLKMEKSVQRLRLDLINEERNILISLRNRELIHDSVMLSVQAELDLREIGLNTDFTYD
ncbi:MAG: hypothetical protein KDK36_06855, partial [Leptospiraceae bacterium]|nr:hypothetical protein [Leptospiraceae bacterium]